VTPDIDLIYEAKTPLGVDLERLRSALQVQVDRDFGPIWGLGCSLSIVSAPRPGVQRLIFLDDADQADALGYHELTPDGLPQGKVFVETTFRDGENPTVTASHELLEMLADPKLNQIERRPPALHAYALEVCDAVEETTYTIDGITVSNFQKPAWFGRPSNERDQIKYDFCGKCIRPWQLLKGGYASVQEINGQWTQVFGSLAAADNFSLARKWRGAARVSEIKARSTR
jgi:hypothetical protein